MLPEEHSTKTEIELLKRDVIVISRLCEKMDDAIDKLQQVASDLSRIVSLQDQKIQIQEKINEEVEIALNTEKKEHITDIRELNHKINAVNHDLSRKINQVELTILEKLERQTEELSKKINTIDTWRYMIMGAIALAVFELGQLLNLDISKLFH